MIGRPSRWLVRLTRRVTHYDSVPSDMHAIINTSIEDWIMRAGYILGKHARVGTGIWITPVYRGASSLPTALRVVSPDLIF
jgi:hypothetical protein